jgi:hypothetical protein
MSRHIAEFFGVTHAFREMSHYLGEDCRHVGITIGMYLNSYHQEYLTAATLLVISTVATVQVKAVICKSNFKLN